jgi:hypothetical protein
VRALGLVNPMLRELAETYYQFGEPFVLDTSKYQAAFGAAGTPLADAIAATLAWYRVVGLAAGAGQEFSQASRSALMVAAWVVGMPWG